MAEYSYKQCQQIHSSRRLYERFGLSLNRHEKKPIVEYLLRFPYAGVGKHPYRKWYYLRIAPCRAFLWLLVDHQSRRMVTAVADDPHGVDKESLEFAREWGESLVRPWALT